MLTIALSKGRILDDTLPLLAAAGIEPTENPDKSRKLLIPTTQDDVRLLIVRATDVPTYVEHGAADLGVAGKDVLMEYGGQGIYEPLDLPVSYTHLDVYKRQAYTWQGIACVHDVLYLEQQASAKGAARMGKSEVFGGEAARFQQGDGQGIAQHQACLLYTSDPFCASTWRQSRA